jgi:phosphoketolase
VPTDTFSPEMLHKMHAYWRAANYLSAGQIDLYDNPLEIPVPAHWLTGIEALPGGVT